MLVFYAMGIPENIASIQEGIRQTAVRSGRDPVGIKLVAVSKTVGLPDIIEAVNAGVTILGENKVQEAAGKISEFGIRISDLKIEWHFIGHLQKNKAKAAVQLFHLIHAVDSVDLAEELNRQAAKADKVQRILVQVKLSDEVTKHGADERDLINLLERISKMNNLKPEGLMTMPPYFEDMEKARPYFKRLRELRDEAQLSGFNLPELSMGMTHDFEAAIEEGATMVRIGTALFGRRT